LLVDDAAKQFDALEVEVFAKNEVGRRFYDSYGFRRIGSSLHEATGEAVLRLALVTKDAEVKVCNLGTSCEGSDGNALFER